MKRLETILVLLLAAILLAACANQYYAPSQPMAANGTGVVDRIAVVDKGASSDVAGTVIGGIVGGLIGHEMGGGSGKTATTVLGAAGGAVAGNQIAKRTRGANQTFRVTVRMDRGGYETVTQDDITNLHTGEHVRIENGRIYHR